MYPALSWELVGAALHPMRPLSHKSSPNPYLLTSLESPQL